MKPHETTSSTLQAELKALHGTDSLLDYLLARVPVTRESYLAFNFPDGVPDPMPGELEANLPRPLQMSSPPAPEAPKTAESGTPSTTSAEAESDSQADREMAEALGYAWPTAG